MAKPTHTLQTLRRSVEQEMGMDFARRFPNGATVTAASDSDADTIVDSKLTQEQDFWKNTWAYIYTDSSDNTANIGQSRLVVGNDPTANSLYLEYPLPVAPSTSAGYEILNWFSALEVHAAINDAIRDGSKAFFDTVTDETLIHEENQLAYTISGLTYAPWIVTKLWLEISDTRRTGIATAGAASSLTDSTANFTGIGAGWLISIYSGTGSGQIRTVTSLTGTTQINVSAAWTTTPDTTSKYAVWNPAEEHEWLRLTQIKFDAKEYPNLFRVPVQIDACLGLRYRLEYTTRPTALTVDSDTTIVPVDYIRPKATSILIGKRIGDNRADRQRWQQEQARLQQAADLYLQQNAFRTPDQTLWQNYSGYTIYNPDNPLDW